MTGLDRVEVCERIIRVRRLLATCDLLARAAARARDAAAAEVARLDIAIGSLR